eukprot:jgi/Hompol1/1694/HPOL_002748-RA
MPTLTVNTAGTAPADIYYEVHGAGPQHILFINGMGSIAHLWDPQVEFFLQYSEFSMCIFDNRGSGQSSSPLGRYTTKMMAKDTVALLAHLGWKKVHVVSVSMGGMIAQELAYILGDDIQSLCLVSTYAKFTTGISVQPASLLNAISGITPKMPTLETLQTTPLMDTLSGLMPKKPTIESFCSMMIDVIFPESWLKMPFIPPSVPSPETPTLPLEPQAVISESAAASSSSGTTMERTSASTTPKLSRRSSVTEIDSSPPQPPRTNKEYALKYFVERFSRTGFQSSIGRAGQHAAVLSHFFDERLSHLRKHKYPVMVLVGDLDQVVRPASSEYLAHHLNAKLVVYPGGGHALRFQDPLWHNMHVLENIRQGILVAQEKLAVEDLIVL